MKSTSKKPSPAATLWWDERGEIACEQHMPYRGSDTFVLGRWRRIRPSEAVAFEADLGRPPSCATCDSIARLNPPY